jgi:hypothetical protein
MLEDQSEVPRLSAQEKSYHWVSVWAVEFSRCLKGPQLNCDCCSLHAYGSPFVDVSYNLPLMKLTVDIFGFAES